MEETTKLMTYALAGTNTYVLTYPWNKSDGYVEMITPPPQLTDEEQLDGKTYIANELGEWKLENDPQFLEIYLQKLQTSDLSNTDKLKQLGQMFLDIANK